MSSGKVLVCVVQFGGRLVHNSDGSISYADGEAHLLDVTRDLSFDEFKSEIAEMCNSDMSGWTFKYLLPTNKKTLITISNDKDLRRMVDFQQESPEVYVLPPEPSTPLKTPCPNKETTPARNKNTRKRKISDPPASTPTVGENCVILRENQNYDASALTPRERLDHMVTIENHDTLIETEDVCKEIHEVPTYTPAELPIVMTGSTEALKRPIVFGETTITGVGQMFKDVHEFRDTLRKYAIAKRFVYEFVKNDGSRVTAKCKAEGCPWRIHASKVSKTKIFKIKTINDAHTCNEDKGTEYYPPPTKHLVASLIKEKLRSTPNYKAKEIVNDIHRDYGLKLNYLQAWRGKEFAREQLTDNDADSYKDLLQYCEKAMETNPDSIATLATTMDGGFHRIFIAFRACINGFEQGCRPLLFLHSASLKLKYHGILLTATAIDGNDGILPVAFGIVEQENFESWQWFLLQFHSGLSSNRSLTFVSDGLKGLKEVVPDVFPNSEHAFCLSYLAEKLKKEMKGTWSSAMEDALADLVYAAARACENDEFVACIESIRSILPEAAVWVMGIEPTQWANVFFRGSWYSQVISNIVECFDSWISSAEDLPILKLVDTIRRRLMEMIYSRWEDSGQCRSRITPKAEEKLQTEMNFARALPVSASSGTKFEVLDENVYTVDLDMWGCTCHSWKLTGVPCRHTIVSVNCIRRDPYDYCERYVTTDCYRLTYAESINPILDVDAVNTGPALARGRRTPILPIERQSRRRQIESSQVNVKRPFHCSKCKGAGHNRATCKTPLTITDGSS